MLPRGDREASLTGENRHADAEHGDMSGTLQFGRFELRPASRQLLVDGRPAALGARAFDVLLALVERQDRIVAKDELLELAWPGLIVEENNLQVQVSALRKVLGAHAIATVPGRGYRFCLAPDAGPASPPSQASAVAAGSGPADVPICLLHLPAERTPLIGREAELARCTAQLQQTRLLTLTGIGGTGKTRLALALARGDAAAHRDGTAFVDLAQVSEPERVGAAVAAATRVDERPGVPLLDVLTEQLSTRELLLVLDNCEHVLGSAAALADALIGRCAALRVVATSREPLGIAGETVHPVPPLALPEAIGDLGALGASSAVQLFVAHARRALPSFALTADNAPLVARICRRLDGVPLALELAAARVALLDVSQIAERLDQRFRLLTGGRDRRQQTLEAVVRWSWDHLAAGDQRLLAALSVFAGSFALETAVPVAGAGDEFEVLDGLARLHAVSLIVVEASNGETRYRLLDTVRHYARQRLGELGETAAARTRHLHAFVERAEATLEWHDAKWHAIFRAEVEDFLSAHAHCGVAPEGGWLGQRLAVALSRKWINGGMLALGLRVTEEALARPNDRDSAVHGWLLLRLALLRLFAGDRAGAQVPLAQAEAIGRALPLPALAARALGMRSDLQPPRERDLPAMKAMAAEAVALARTVPPPQGPTVLSGALMSYGNNLYWLDELEAAEAAYREGFDLCLARGDPTNASVAASNIVDARLRAGTDQGVRELLLYIARVERETRSSMVARNFLNGCRRLALQRGQWRDALVLDAAARALAVETGLDPEPLADVPARLAAARATLGDADADAAQAEGSKLSFDAAVAHAHAWLSQQPD
jgi:predicted ATPase